MKYISTYFLKQNHKNDKRTLKKMTNKLIIFLSGQLLTSATSDLKLRIVLAQIMNIFRLNLSSNSLRKKIK